MRGWKHIDKQTTIMLWIGFIVTLIGYSFYPFMWYRSWFDLKEFSALIFLYTFFVYLRYQKSKAQLTCFIVFLSSVYATTDEWFFNPNIIEWNEYFSFIITVIITIIYKKKWIR